MGQNYEVEVKSLLGSAERAEALRHAMKQIDPSCEMIIEGKQLNHYFEPSASHDQKAPIEQLLKKIAPHLPAEHCERLRDLATRATNYSVRTRLKEENDERAVFLIAKATVGSDTSENGVARMEFEERVPMTLVELDELVMSSGFKYQAKWSRAREEYRCLGVNVTLDKNAGYGWLAEFERVVDDPEKTASAEREVRTLMDELGAPELPQDRLERMFAHYNAHWKEYYGTDRIFVIE